MSYGLLLIRVVLGGTMSAHGAQKLFGWFGGPGPRGTAGFFAGLGFGFPLGTAILAGTAEFGGGILLALGLFTPFAAFAIAAVMVTAVRTVHWKNGFFSGNGGYELNLLIFAVAVGLAATGPGRFSVDSAAPWAGSFSGLWCRRPRSKRPRRPRHGRGRPHPQTPMDHTPRLERTRRNGSPGANPILRLSYL